MRRCSHKAVEDEQGRAGDYRASYRRSGTTRASGQRRSWELEAYYEAGRLARPAELADRSLAASQGAAAPGPEVAVVVAGRVGSHKVLGVYPAQAQAQARTPGLTILEADPQAHAAALDALPLWALRHYAPLVARRHRRRLA